MKKNAKALFVFPLDMPQLRTVSISGSTIVNVRSSVPFVIVSLIVLKIVDEFRKTINQQTL